MNADFLDISGDLSDDALAALASLLIDVCGTTDDFGGRLIVPETMS